MPDAYRALSMTFAEAYRALKENGAQTIEFKTQGSNHIDVWASELQRGPRKGQPVIRIQWGNSSSTLDSDMWSLDDKHPMLNHVQIAIASALLGET
jgi:hypothetical protein